MSIAERSLPPIRRRAVPSFLAGLVGTPLNAAITLAYAGVLVFAVWPFLRWAVIDAVWSGPRAACDGAAGACWAFVSEKLRFLVFGLYPRDLHWQSGLAAAIVVLAVVASALPRTWGRALPALWIGAIGLAVAVMGGDVTGRPVATQNWGGLPLTLLLAVVGFVGAFPIGILLALGRRSRMGLVRVASTVFVEVLRGVPMIAVLYVSTLVLPLMLPAGAPVDKLLRAQVAIVLFAAAYMAEIVRAGLKAVPNGQLEAALSIGLTWWQAMRLVVLPQALKAVIPSFVNLAIGLFLDTTLVIVIGLFDFLNTARAAAADPDWLGYYDEAFAFAALVYFTVAAAGSRYSLWLERRLASAARS